MTFGPRITINPEQLTNVFNQLLAIVQELETNALPAIEEISDTAFYTDGKAKDAMDVYAEANRKFLELMLHYDRIATLVNDTLLQMALTDRLIADRIIAAMEV
ncbi:hypothetical protein SFC66_06425 [Terribacillus saccharophilus]|uniref:hypothetical protein n=1 Tax=Terribacillus saccharophilus TaxID=361277 RepID=UPI003981DFA1